MFCFYHKEFVSNDKIGGIHSESPVNKTDELNANLAMLGLCISKKHYPHLFSELDVHSKNTQEALRRRPMCRWEIHNLTVTLTSNSVKTETEIDTDTNHNHSVDVQIILDVGHNPAALAALSRRIATEFSEQNVQ